MTSGFFWRTFAEPMKIRESQITDGISGNCGRDIAVISIYTEKSAFTPELGYSWAVETRTPIAVSFLCKDLRIDSDSSLLNNAMPIFRHPSVTSLLPVFEQKRCRYFLVLSKKLPMISNDEIKI